MADDIPTRPRGDQVEPDIAAADWLLGDEEQKRSSPSTPKPTSPAADEVFDLADGSSSDWIEVNRSVSPNSPSARESAKKTRTAPAPQADPEQLVPETWSRMREWGPNLLVLGAWGFSIALVSYFILGQEHYYLALLTFLAGIVGGAVLAYPMLITLERPVRITPEQAVRDYYAALSHHVPHLRRMWLLLSAAGRVSYSFGSYEGFKGYWRGRLADLRSGHAGPLTPLVFEVTEFKSDKSAGKTAIDATFVVKVFVRGKRGQGPVRSIPCRLTLVRGPDKMWYLENGLLSAQA